MTGMFTFNQQYGGTAGQGVYLINMPFGLSIDSSLVVMDDGMTQNGTMIGSGMVYNVGGIPPTRAGHL